MQIKSTIAGLLMLTAATLASGKAAQLQSSELKRIQSVIQDVPTCTSNLCGKLVSIEERVVIAKIPKPKKPGKGSSEGGSEGGGDGPEPYYGYPLTRPITRVTEEPTYAPKPTNTKKSAELEVPEESVTSEESTITASMTTTRPIATGNTSDIASSVPVNAAGAAFAGSVGTLVILALGAVVAF